jgi:hypothetical protein
MSAANPIPPASASDPHGYASSTNPALIAAAWLLVGVPLIWGVSQTFLKSLDLFRAPAAPAVKSAATAPPPPPLPAPEPQPTPAPR